MLQTVGFYTLDLLGPVGSESELLLAGAAGCEVGIL